MCRLEALCNKTWLPTRNNLNSAGEGPQQDVLDHEAPYWPQNTCYSKQQQHKGIIIPAKTSNPKDSNYSANPQGALSLL